MGTATQQSLTHQSKTYAIGAVSVTRVSEITLEAIPPVSVFPDWKPELLSENKSAAEEAWWGASHQQLSQSIHTWVLHTPQHTILIDTSTGNDKERPFAPALDHLKEPFLQRLQAASVLPEEVDYVLMTHIHVDHVGWNTQLKAGKWLPTFPKAKYFMPQVEHEFFADPRNRNHPRYGVYADSILPVVEAGMAEFIGPQGGEVVDGISYLPTPGHSLGHMSIILQSQGQEAIFGGDVMHHPLQVCFPQLNSIYCEDQEKSRNSRLKALEFAADRHAIYFSTHFPESSAGEIVRRNASYTWKYL